jgi:hypothetical protein
MGRASSEDEQFLDAEEAFDMFETGKNFKAEYSQYGDCDIQPTRERPQAPGRRRKRPKARALHLLSRKQAQLPL